MPIEISSTAQLLPRKPGMLEILGNKLLNHIDSRNAPGVGKDTISVPKSRLPISQGPILQNDYTQQALPLKSVGERLLSAVSDPAMDLMQMGMPIGMVKGGQNVEKAVSQMWDLVMSNKKFEKAFSAIQEGKLKGSDQLRGELIDLEELAVEFAAAYKKDKSNPAKLLTDVGNNLIGRGVAKEQAIDKLSMELDRGMPGGEEGETIVREIAAPGQSVEEAAITREQLSRADLNPLVADPRLAMAQKILTTSRPRGGRAPMTLSHVNPLGQETPGVREIVTPVRMEQRSGYRSPLFEQVETALGSEGMYKNPETLKGRLIRDIPPSRPLAPRRYSDSLEGIAKDYGFSEDTARRAIAEIKAGTPPAPAPLLSLKKTINSMRQPEVERLISASDELGDVGKRAMRSYLFGGTKPSQIINDLGIKDKNSLRAWMETLIKKGGFVE